jgi:hypothetical protein
MSVPRSAESAVPSEASWPAIERRLMHGSRPAPLPFPLAQLPPAWADWVEGAAPSFTSVDYVAQALLGAVSALCGGRFLVEVAPQWREPPVLWQALVGGPSTGKTPALALGRGLVERVLARRGARTTLASELMVDARADMLARTASHSSGSVALWCDDLARRHVALGTHAGAGRMEREPGLCPRAARLSPYRGGPLSTERRGDAAGGPPDVGPCRHRRWARRAISLYLAGAAARGCAPPAKCRSAGRLGDAGPSRRSSRDPEGADGAVARGRRRRGAAADPAGAAGLHARHGRRRSGVDRQGSGQHRPLGGTDRPDGVGRRGANAGAGRREGRSCRARMACGRTTSGRMRRRCSARAARRWPIARPAASRAGCAASDPMRCRARRSGARRSARRSMQRWRRS